MKLENCSDKQFISPIVITVKKDQTIKLAMESKQIKKAIGVALEQETPDGWSFFAYASRFLNTRESNYCVSKIQMLTRCRP